jgi:hypothetical protein
MKLSLMAAVLSTFCLAGCETARIMVPVAPPADRIDCRPLDAGRPGIPPEHVIDWTRVVTVEQARAEVQALVTSVRAREGVAAGYIVELEGVIFACASDAAWLRDLYGAADAPPLRRLEPG